MYIIANIIAFYNCCPVYISQIKFVVTLNAADTVLTAGFGFLTFSSAINNFK